MFAIVRTGGKQYRVAPGDEIIVDRLPGVEAGARVELATLRFAADAPAAVTAEIVAHTKGDKIIIFKKKRRHNYRRRNGHRQLHTVLRIVAVGDDTAAAKE
jgi:large subunit ribosomal protein L21